MQTYSLAEKYTLSIILAAGVLKSRKLTPWTFSPMVSGAGCQNFYQLRRSPKKTPLRSIRFCDTTTIFRSSQNVWQIPKICIVSALISMGNFGELSACLLARASGFMITNSFNIWTRWNVRSPVKDIRWQPSNEKTITTSHAIISFVCCSRRINFWGEWLIFEPSDMTLFHWSLIVLVGTSTMVIEIDSTWVLNLISILKTGKPLLPLCSDEILFSSSKRPSAYLNFEGKRRGTYWKESP